MNAMKLRRALALGILTVAAFNTLAALSLPRAEIKPPIWRVLLWLVLLVAHALGYWFADDLGVRLRQSGYIALQAGIVFAVGVSGALFPVGAGLYIALTIYAVIVAGARWGTVQITFAAILLFALSAILTSNLYGGAMIGLLLAVAGVIGHAAAALFRRVPVDAAVASPPINGASRPELTARENEVLDALVRGARNREIAAQLGITERTVKAHLASIYSKLGVESRTAAVAVAKTHR